MKGYRPARKRVAVSVGESVSAIENDRVRLGVERAKTLAAALKCHPAVLVLGRRRFESGE